MFIKKTSLNEYLEKIIVIRVWFRVSHINLIVNIFFSTKVLHARPPIYTHAVNFFLQHKEINRIEAV